MSPGRISVESGSVGYFLSTFNFDLWYFCSLLTYRSVQYLTWKIWLISVWRLKARAMAGIFTWFMFAQNTLCSYHTEAFVKTEFGCTVPLMPLEKLDTVPHFKALISGARAKAWQHFCTVPSNHRKYNFLYRGYVLIFIWHKSMYVSIQCM